MQVAKPFNNYSSFVAMPYLDKLVIIYNDNSNNLSNPINETPVTLKNIGNSGLAMATIDKDGLITRSVVYDHKETIHTTQVNTACIISNKKIAFYGAKSNRGKFRIGILQID